jgi:hypothetical protein
VVAGALLLAACAGLADGEASVSIHTAPAPSSAERYCAWFGDVGGGILYFGQAAFWSALLPPLDVSAGGDRSGVWDVLAHPNGRIYFTTYFESAGYADLRTGELRRLQALGPGLNELAPGPRGSILISRYGAAPGAAPSGSILLVDLDGRLLAEHPLQAPAGFAALPKTVGFDPSRAEIWVTTDLLPEEPTEQREPEAEHPGPRSAEQQPGAGNREPRSPNQNGHGAIRHDARVLDTSGEEKRRIAEPEIQFVAFRRDGTGYRAELDGRDLRLRAVPAKAPHPDPGWFVSLDDAFPAQLDFVQDIHLLPDGRAVVTRWSGWIHVVEPPGRVRSVRLPTPASGGLYYSGVLAGDRLCATYCADVSVVCRDAP